MSNRRRRLTRASAPPATPREEGGNRHPAERPDPGMHDYENGNTSSWAEDVHRGPYDGSIESPAPATPQEEGGYKHPAAKKARLEELRRERKAAVAKSQKCVEIATYHLGKRASDQEIEDHAFSYMSLPDRQIDIALKDIRGRQAACDYMEDEMMDDDMMGLDMISSEDDEEMMGWDMMEDDEEMMGLDDVGMEDLYAYGSDYMEDEDMMDFDIEEDLVDPGLDIEEDMMAEMLAGQNDPSHWYEKKASFGGLSKVATSMLLEMLAEEESYRLAADEDDDDDDEEVEEVEEEVEEDDADDADDDDDEEEDEGDDEDVEATSKKASYGLSDSLSQPLNIMDDFELSETDRDKLAVLHGDYTLSEEDDALFQEFFGRSANEDQDEASDEDDDAEMMEDEHNHKKASVALKPMSRKKSRGIQSLGHMSRKAAEDIDVESLSSIWKTKPDVSDYFNGE